MLPSSQLPHLSCWSMQFLHSSSENSHIGSFTAAAELSRKQSTRLRLAREEDSRMLSIQRQFADKSAIAGEFPVCHSTRYMLSSHNRNTGVLNWTYEGRKDSRQGTPPWLRLFNAPQIILTVPFKMCPIFKYVVVNHSIQRHIHNSQELHK